MAAMPSFATPIPVPSDEKPQSRGRASTSDRVRRLAKAAAWACLGVALGPARLASTLLARTRSVDVIIYKVDRLGDWLLAEPAIARIVSATRAKGGTVVVWAGRESAAYREWRRPDFEVETVSLEPRGLVAKLLRACAIMRLLAVYRARALVCLRHTPEPVRDFVLSHACAEGIHALSRRLASGPPDGVPHEIARHFAILAGLGMEPADVRDLLPRLPGRVRPPARRVVLAPFSSATIKDWRDESWCDVVAGLADRGFQFEIWVSADQMGRAEGLARRLEERAGGLKVAARSGKLAELADAVGSASLVLTVDTFAAHLAAAMDAPMVCAIGGGLYGDFGPWSNSWRQRWVTHEVPCFGCGWRCSRPRVECLEDIRPSTFLSELEDVLKRDAG